MTRSRHEWCDQIRLIGLKLCYHVFVALRLFEGNSEAPLPGFESVSLKAMHSYIGTYVGMFNAMALRPGMQSHAPDQGV